MGINEEERARVAVSCRDIYKQLGRGRDATKVLCGLNMTVPYGSIYGLLGASGCGKTTLLKCIVGKLKIDKGHVNTLGKAPRSEGHKVPGRMVGYMPQDISLYMDFTIGETLTFFGRLHGMSTNEINERREFLVKFLHLPSHNRLVNQLSGGQQRRVSLATALLQEPELLILDEPTVGVDPVLRERIWEHLLEIAKSSMKTTIIITTHYIEEAAQADVVGFMRGGRLLAENQPCSLTLIYKLPNLEAVFLHLCHQDKVVNVDDDDKPPPTSELSPQDTKQESLALYKKNYENGGSVHLPAKSGKTVYGTLAAATSGSLLSSSKWCSLRSCLPVPRNVLALTVKNVIAMRRNAKVMVYQFAIPMMEIVLFCVCVGKDPHGLSVSICNEDKGGLGDMFVSLLSNKTMNKIYTDSLQAAIHNVKMGTSWAAIHLRKNFTHDLMSRVSDGLLATNDTLDGSSVWVYQDNTDQEISLTLKMKIMEAFNSFADHMMSKFGLNPDAIKIPLKIGDPVYGKNDTNFTEFMIPGLILSLTFFLATGLTTLSFVLERKQGLLERVYIAGVNAIEIMIAHINAQLLVMLGQILLMLLLAFLAFDIPIRGSVFALVLMLILQGLCGMALGMTISVCCNTETAAVQGVLSTLYPSLVLNGIIWPIEAMPHWLMNFSLCLPQTYPTYAMRAIISRGWGLDMQMIWLSYLISLAWTFGLAALSAIAGQVIAD